MTPKGLSTKLFSCLLIAVPIIAFYAVYSAYSINTPIIDDFDSPILSSLNLFKSKSLSEFWNIVIGFHSDHRLAYLRLQALAFIKIFGDLNLRHVILFNLGLLVPYFILTNRPLWKAGKYIETSIIAAISFVMTYETALYFAHVSTNYIPLILFVSFAIYFVCRPEVSLSSFLFSALFSVIAILTFGNGIFVLLVVFLILLARKYHKYAAVWLVFSVVLAVWYFHDHKQAEYLSQVSYFDGIPYKIKGFLYLLGNFHGLSDHQLLPSMAMGVLLVVLFCSLFFYKFSASTGLKPVEYFYLGHIAFFIITLLLIVAGRLGQNDAELAPILVSGNRYRFYSIFSVAAGLGWVFYNYEIKKYYLLVLCFATLFINVSSFYINKRDFDYHLKNKYCANYNWLNNNTGLNYYLGDEPEAVRRLNELRKEGYFVPPTTEIFNQTAAVLDSTRKIKPKIDRIVHHRVFGKFKIDEKTTEIENQLFEKSSTVLEGCYVMLKSKTSTYFFPMLAYAYKGRNFLKNGTGAKATISEALMKKDSYELFFYEVVKNNNPVLLPTNETVVIE